MSPTPDASWITPGHAHQCDTGKRRALGFSRDLDGPHRRRRIKHGRLPIVLWVPTPELPELTAP